MSTLFTDRPGNAFSLEQYESYLASHMSMDRLDSLGNEGLTDTLKSFVPTALRTLFGVVRELPKDDITILKRDQYVFLNQLKKYEYTDFRQLSLIIPAGLKVDYLTFIQEFLSPSVTFLEKTFQKDLKDFVSYTGGLVNRPLEKLKSLDKININQAAESDKIKNSLGKYILPNNPITNAPYQKAILRNKDWEKILTSLYDLTYRLNKLQPKVLNKQVHTAQTHLSKFNTWLDKDTNGQQVTPEAIKMMADYSLSLAKQAEFYTLVHYMLTVCNSAMSNNINTVQESFSKK